MGKNTTSSALKKATSGTTVNGADGVAALAERLTADRLKRKLTWPNYANHLGEKLSTIYKIASGATTRPHALTMARIIEKLDGTPAEGAADAVVSGGQRHPERPEN